VGAFPAGVGCLAGVERDLGGLDECVGGALVGPADPFRWGAGGVGLFERAQQGLDPFAGDGVEREVAFVGAVVVGPAAQRPAGVGPVLVGGEPVGVGGVLAPFDLVAEFLGGGPLGGVEQFLLDRAAFAEPAPAGGTAELFRLFDPELAAAERVGGVREPFQVPPRSRALLASRPDTLPRCFR
jgi:hypothetical protein